jgi:probable aminopeptidase NPEPL1
MSPAGHLGKKKWSHALGSPFDGLVVDLAAQTSSGDLGTTASTLVPRESATSEVRTLLVGVLPDKVSRYNAPSRAESIRRSALAAAATKGKLAIVIVLDSEEHVGAAVMAASRAFPLFSAKSSNKVKDRLKRSVEIVCLDAHGKFLPISQKFQDASAAIRDAAALVDTPPSELHPASFAAAARQSLRGIKGVKITEIVGEDLQKAGLGGIYGVGKGAVVAPRMVVATYAPPAKAKANGPHIALIGKGVTFDTGGLHLKPRGGIEGMKCDMGGAAAMLSAFRLLASQHGSHKVTLILCLAENAIGPASYKPDDILTLHSGKTVEINNTDAEGRLLLADGLSYAVRELKADVVIDAATLTGAQLIATGTMHAAVISNDQVIEEKAVAAGFASGELVHPLIFAPEFYRHEFPSPVADMTNTVANRNNAQSSCAAQFLWWHIEDTNAKWLHIDLAGPAFLRGRGTGFGVGLVTELCERIVSRSKS